MGYVVPFMNGKGGTGKSVLARAYAVEAARSGASVLIADLDDVQRTTKRWADHRKTNGLKPEIRVEVATPRLAWDMRDRASLLVIDTPGWTDQETLKMARWSTFCVIPSRANRMDDLSEAVRLMHAPILFRSSPNPVGIPSGRTMPTRPVPGTRSSQTRSMNTTSLFWVSRGFLRPVLVGLCLARSRTRRATDSRQA